MAYALTGVQRLSGRSETARTVFNAGAVKLAMCYCLWKKLGATTVSEIWPQSLRYYCGAVK